MAVADDGRKPLQAAHVRDDGDLHLPHAERRVLACVANVAGGDEVNATAREIAENPPLVVHGIKDVLDQERAARVAAGLRYVAAWNAAFMASEDLTEAMTAVFAQRKPEFQGR